jgi:hypothetical protein
MEKEIIEIEKQAISVDRKAQGLIVRNQEEYDFANSFLKSIKELQAKVKDTFGPIIAKAFQAHKEAKAQEAKHLEPLVRAESLIKNKMLDFLREQEKIRQEQERKLQAEAEKKRQEALAKAEKAREEGKEAKAEKYEDKAAGIVAPILAPTVDKGSVAVKKLYHAEVYDLMALVKAIAENKAPLNLIEANMPVLNSQARSLKEGMNYPGVKAVAEDNLSTRRI